MEEAILETYDFETNEPLAMEAKVRDLKAEYRAEFVPDMTSLRGTEFYREGDDLFIRVDWEKCRITVLVLFESIISDDAEIFEPYYAN